mmetsp:Transcript_36491/g.145874  ORF Transcript_36491/g.145874 Transcript_36491/m.145874 type:complete len:161 (-) Transcript_36491:2769-3251(-)
MEEDEMKSTAMRMPSTRNVDTTTKRLGAEIILGIHGAGDGTIQGSGDTVVERTAKNARMSGPLVAITIGVVARGEIRDTTMFETGDDSTDTAIAAVAEVEAEALVEAEIGFDLEVGPADNILDGEGAPKPDGIKRPGGWESLTIFNQISRMKLSSAIGNI